MRAPLGHQSIWFSCQRPTRSALHESHTTTSKRITKRLHAHRRPTNGMSSCSLSRIVQILPSIWKLRSTSCCPGEVDMTARGVTGADRIPIEDMCMSTNKRSLNSAVLPRATRLTRIFSTTGSCRHSRVYQYHFDVPMFNFLSTIKSDFQAAHRRTVHWRDQAFNPVIVGEALSLVTAETVPLALQNALADGQ